MTPEYTRRKHRRLASERVLVFASLFVVAVFALLCLTQPRYEQARLKRELIASVVYHRTAKVHQLLAAGVDPNSLALEPTTPEESLIWGIKRASGINLRQSFRLDRAAWDNPPLVTAAVYNYDDIAELLLRYGADANADDSWMPPLVAAAGHGNIRLMRLLLQYGANVDSAGVNGQTALKEVADGLSYTRLSRTASAEDCARILIRQGANVNDADDNGQTPLMAAVESGDIAVVRLLIRHGADVNVRDKQGMTPLRQAIRLKGQAFTSGWTAPHKKAYKSIIALLQEAGGTA